MDFRHRLIAAICGAALSSFAFSSPAVAQIESEGMDDISVWGERYLSSNEAEFSSNLWAGADHQRLLSLMRNIDVDQLSLAGRTMVRRLVLSSTQNVTGPQADALLARRAALMLALNEIDAAMALLPNLGNLGAVIEPDILATDLELAAGNIATGCDRLSQPVSQNVYWTKLRAACAAMSGNYSGAQLTIEMASEQLFEDTWFIELIYSLEDDILPSDEDISTDTAADPAPETETNQASRLLRPGASFASGLDIALSLSEDLDTAALDPDTIAPYLIPILINRQDLPVQLRQLFAGTDTASALMSGTEIRALVEAGLVAPDDYILAPEQATILQLQTPETDFYDKADVLTQHLDQASSGSLKDFRRISQLYTNELLKLPQDNRMVAYADLFARAAYASGDGNNARAWLDIAYPAPVPPKPAPFSPAPKPVSLGSDPNDLGTGPVPLDAAAGVPFNLGSQLEGPEADNAAAAPLAVSMLNADDIVLDSEAVTHDDTVFDNHDEAPLADAAPGLNAPVEMVDAADNNNDLSEAIALAEANTVKSRPADVEVAVAPRPDIYISLVFDLFDSLSDGAAHQSDIIPRLIEAAERDGETEQVVKLLYHLPAFGFSLDTSARSLLLEYPVTGQRLDPNIVATIQATSTAPAIAEATLMILAIIEDEPHNLSAWDQGLILSALVEIGADDIATLLLQDFSQYWQAEQRPARAMPTHGMWDALNAGAAAEQPLPEAEPEGATIS